MRDIRRRLMISALGAGSGDVLLGSLDIGDKIALKMNGVDHTWIVANKGAPAFSGGIQARYTGFEGGVILVKETASQWWQGTPTNWAGWAGSPLREQMVGFAATFDAQTQSAIMTVGIPAMTSSGSRTSDTGNGVWVPSVAECGGHSSAPSVDGGVLAYFADPSTRAARLKASFDGQYRQYATRSGYAENVFGTNFYKYFEIDTDGQAYYNEESGASIYCRLCVVLPETLRVKVVE